MEFIFLLIILILAISNRNNTGVSGDYGGNFISSQWGGDDCCGGDSDGSCDE